MLDMAVVIPQLAKYGGAERLVVECLSRWQHKHKITVYAQQINKAMLTEHGIAKDVTFAQLSPSIEDNTFSFLLNGTFMPKAWSGEIGQHDVYNTHLWPLHLLDVAPAVWYPHEPLRMLYDLKSNTDIVSITSEKERRTHIYPKYEYDVVQRKYFQPMLRTATAFDQVGTPYRIVANSRYSAEYIRTIYDREVSRVVYPGVTPEDFLPPMSSEYVLTVGQLWAHKRIHLILQTMRQLDNMQLYIAGSGPEKENLINQARELGIYDRTFFLSGLTNQELQIVFSRALAVVFVPVREPFGIVALEALAASKPLVAVDEGGYVEAVDDQCAFLVPPTVNALADKLLWLRDNPVAAAAMGRHGREIARQYSWDRTAAELLEEIEDARAAWRDEHPLSVTSGAQKTLFGAHYYGWYGDGLGQAHWNDTSGYGVVTVMPQLGYYASFRADIAEQHLRMAEAAGLDFLLCNLHLDGEGPDAATLKSFSLLLDRAEYLQSSVRVCLQLCVSGNTGKPLSALLAELRRTAFRHPWYCTLRERPLLSCFWTGEFDGDAVFLKLLRREAGDVTLLASSLRLYPLHEEPSLTFGTFDGWSLFSPLELCAPASWESVWRQAYADAGGLGIRCVTVSPGYDDTALTSAARHGNPHRSVPRQGGAVYRRMWEFALALPEPPGVVLVSTFNEFHENTHIEPTVEDGGSYLRLTRGYVDRGRALWNR